MAPSRFLASSYRARLLVAGAALALFGTVLGLKWAVVDRFGSAMPDWDQWDAEALQLLVPWFEGDHFLYHLFTPHNEHRVVLTKLQNLALTLLGGQWDARVECVFNALLHSAFIAMLWLFAVGWAGWRASAPLFLLAVALFGLPHAWQNVLGGFHSQQSWLVALSFTAIVILPLARIWSAVWWTGAIAAILALGSMASGFLAAAVVLVVSGFRLWRRETVWSVAWPTLAVCGGVVVVGLLTRVEVDYHQVLKATTLHDFVTSNLRSLAWPWRHRDWAGLVLWAPWALCAWQALICTPRLGTPLPKRLRPSDVVRVTSENSTPPAAPVRNLRFHTCDTGTTDEGKPVAGAERVGPYRGGRVAEMLLSALGGWVLLQIVATAYTRGAGAHYPASRYMDTLALGAFVNGVALAWLSSSGGWRRTEAVSGPTAGRPRLRTAAVAAFALGWLWLLGLGLWTSLHRALTEELPEARRYYRSAEFNLRAYLASDDPQYLDHPDIPFPSAADLIERLAIPSLRALMPAVVRAPLAMAADPALEPSTNSTFIRNPPPSSIAAPASHHGLTPATPPLGAVPTWGSFGPDGRSAVGEWRSAPLEAPPGAWLKFETAGDSGAAGAGVALELHAAQSGALLDSVTPSRVPGDSWRAAYVRAPPVPFVVVARDEGPDAWLGFSPPVEMGALSYGAWRVARHGWLIAPISFLTAGIIGLVAVGRWWPVASAAR